MSTSPFCSHEPWQPSRGPALLSCALCTVGSGEERHPPGSALLPDRCSFSSSDAHASRPTPPNSPFPSYLCYSSCHEDFNTRWKPLSTLPLSELECFQNLQLPIPWHGLPQGSQLPFPAPPGPCSWPFQQIAAPQYLSPPSLSSPSLAIACPLCLLSSTPHTQGALIQNSSGPTRTCKLATLPLPWPSSPLSPPSLHSLGSAVFNRTTPPSLFTPILGQPPAAVIVTCTSYLPSSQTAKHSGEKHTTWLMSFTSVTAHLKGIPSVSQMSSLDHAGPFAASSLLFLHP